jgi:hypothetical protein
VAQPAGGEPLFLQSERPVTLPRFARLAAAALVAGAVAAGAAGCGGRHPRPAALRLERADLVLLTRALQRLEAPTHSEVAAARTVWPTLARGLPRGALPPATALALAAAERRAGALAPPWYVTTEAGGLTGPAAAVGGLLKAYAALTPRGWRFIAAALAPGSAAAASFMRANAGLYIYAIYDGHYDLSLIGKTLHDAYRKLGGPPAFGSTLTPGQVEALVRAYSIPATRLAPHPRAGLAV